MGIDLGASEIALGALAASAASAAVGTVGAISSSEAASSSARYNAEVAQQNQTIAQQNATQAIQAGEAQAGAAEQKTRAEEGAIVASQAASGIDVNTGSAADVQASAASEGQLDALTVRSNASRVAYGYETQGTSFADQAALEEAQASNDTTAGAITGASTFLGGMGSAATNYARFLAQNSPFVAPGGETTPPWQTGPGGMLAGPV